MKALLPTLKQKKRYVVFEVISETAIKSYEELRASILSGCLSALGELGMAEAGLRLIDTDYDPVRQRGVIRVGHKHVERLGLALALMQKIGRVDAAVRCVGVSGILSKAEERYILS